MIEYTRRPYGEVATRRSAKPLWVGATPTVASKYNMSIKPVCDFCKEELTDFGALLFSPPDADNSVKKFHLCQNCYEKVIATYTT
ncbi:MAG: hypothetical protein JWM46_411 [Candidatus Kaiserbacteria bacterium]|nr:hypothetical protein [Candidatus Kaiserbacteria bacterium]